MALGNCPTTRGSRSFSRLMRRWMAYLIGALHIRTPRRFSSLFVQSL
jgi:hypothetical protein